MSPHSRLTTAVCFLRKHDAIVAPGRTVASDCVLNERWYAEWWRHVLVLYLVSACRQDGKATTNPPVNTRREAYSRVTHRLTGVGALRLGAGPKTNSRPAPIALINRPRRTVRPVKLHAAAQPLYHSICHVSGFVSNKLNKKRNCQVHSRVSEVCDSDNPFFLFSGFPNHLGSPEWF